MINAESKNSLILDTLLKDVPEVKKAKFHGWYIYKDSIIGYKRQQLAYTENRYTHLTDSLTKEPNKPSNLESFKVKEYPFKPNSLLHSFLIWTKEEDIKEVSYGIIYVNDDGTYSKFEVNYNMDFESDKAFLYFRKFNVDKEMRDHLEWDTSFSIVTNWLAYERYDLSKLWPRECFIEKFGHADIVMKREPGAKGSGNVVEDGYSIGYEGVIGSVNGKEDSFIKYKIRQNISNKNQEPSYVLRFESSFNIPIDVCIHSTHDEYCITPKTHLELEANASSQIILQPGHITKDNIIEGSKEKNEPTVAKSTNFQKAFNSLDEFTFEPSSVSPIIVKSSNLYSNLLIERNFGIGYLTPSKKDPKTQLLGHIWFALSQVDDDPLAPVNYPIIDQTYIYLAGGTSELRQIASATIELTELEAEGVIAKIIGSIPRIGVYYEIKVFSSLALNTPAIKVAIETTDKPLYGKLDIISDIDFGFYKDGVIPIEMKPHKKFVFDGK